MRRLGAVGLLVAAASAVVAIGAPGVGLLLPLANLNGGWALAARMAGAVAVIAGSVGLLVQRKRLRSNTDRRYDPTAAALVAARDHHAPPRGCPRRADAGRSCCCWRHTLERSGIPTALVSPTDGVRPAISTLRRWINALQATRSGARAR